MRVRRLLGAVIAVMAVPVAIVSVPRSQAASAVPTAVAACLALGVVVGWPGARDRVAWPGLIAAGASLAGTVVIVASGDAPAADSDTLGLAEMAGLLVLLALVARWSPPRIGIVAGLALGVAATSWILRFMAAEDLLTTIGGCFMWSLGAVVATAAGGYPRLAAERLRRSVAQAQDSQRLQLAHDLHDFIAHDVTGMVAQAQAARFAAGDDPAALRTALERIEATGQEALSAMDTIVEMLRGDADPAAGFRALGLKGLPDIVDAFRRERQDGSVTLRADDALVSELPPEIQLAATRVVVEGLTNVRRHAATARDVAVVVESDGPGRLAVQVSNDKTTTSRAETNRRTAGGTGLSTLGERIRRLGGRLEAGPDGAGGWLLRCELPISHGAASRLPGRSSTSPST